MDYSDNYSLVKSILQNKGITVSDNSLSDIISEIISGMNTFNDYKLAKIKSSLDFRNSTDKQFVYSLARSLYGYSPKRKISSKVKVKLTQTPGQSATFPIYSRFKIGEWEFVNIEEINITQEMSYIEFELTQGELQEESFNINNKSKVTLAIDNWQVENDSVITNLNLKKAKDFIDFENIETLSQVTSQEELGTVKIEDLGYYIDYTNYKGQTILEFLLISDLRLSDTFTVKYLKSVGAQAKNLITDLEVKIQSEYQGSLAEDYVIKTISAIAGGKDEENLEEIKLSSFYNIRNNKNSCCTYDEYYSKLCNFEGIYLCNIWNEKTELANQFKNCLMMNRYYYSIIFNSLTVDKVTRTVQENIVYDLNSDPVVSTASLIPGYFRIYPISIIRDLEEFIVKDNSQGLLYSELIEPYEQPTDNDVELEFSNPDKISDQHPIEDLLDPSQETYFEFENPSVELSTYSISIKFKGGWVGRNPVNLIRFRYPNLVDFPTQNNLVTVNIYSQDQDGNQALLSISKSLTNIQNDEYSEYVVLKEVIDGSKYSSLSIEITGTYYDNNTNLYPVRISNIQFGYSNPEENYINYETKTYRQTFIKRSTCNLIVGYHSIPDNVSGKVDEYFKDSKELLVELINKEPKVSLVDFDLVVYLKNSIAPKNEIQDTIKAVIIDYMKHYRYFKLLEINTLLFNQSVISNNCKAIDFKSPSSDLESLELIFYQLGNLMINFK